MEPRLNVIQKIRLRDCRVRRLKISIVKSLSIMLILFRY